MMELLFCFCKEGFPYRGKCNKSLEHSKGSKLSQINASKKMIALLTAWENYKHIEWTLAFPSMANALHK